MNTTTDTHSKITVLGAGVVGVTTALALKQDGHDVEIIDRLPPGEACSFGNSGGMPRSHAFPMATPGIIWKVPGFLINPMGPLAIRWSHLWELAPWLLRFARASTGPRFVANLDHLIGFMRISHQEWTTLIATAGLKELIREDGALTIYRTTNAREQAWPIWQMFIERGGDLTRIEHTELLSVEPAAPRDYVCAVYEPDYRRTVDPYRLTIGLMKRFTEMGGQVRRETVSEIDIAADNSIWIRTNISYRKTDMLVVAAGVWSKRFAERFGHRVPLESARGYHVTFLNVSHMPRHALFISDMQLSLTPMRMGLRVGGNVEFAGIEAPPDFRRPERQIDNVRRLYPNLEVEPHTKWVGDRPMMPDSLPVIGRSSSNRNVVFAFGHGQYGLALAAGTARLVADLIGNRASKMDLAPFSIDRF
jgi:D-amino-acid dehydrogenase